MKQETTEPSFLYEPPAVEVVEVCVELGFAGSPTGVDTPDWGHEPGYWG